jgi:hypothetical protein
MCFLVWNYDKEIYMRLPEEYAHSDGKVVVQRKAYMVSRRLLELGMLVLCRT